MTRKNVRCITTFPNVDDNAVRKVGFGVSARTPVIPQKILQVMKIAISGTTLTRELCNLVFCGVSSAPISPNVSAMFVLSGTPPNNVLMLEIGRRSENTLGIGQCQVRDCRFWIPNPKFILPEKRKWGWATIEALKFGISL